MSTLVELGCCLSFLHICCLSGGALDNDGDDGSPSAEEVAPNQLCLMIQPKDHKTATDVYDLVTAAMADEGGCAAALCDHTVTGTGFSLCVRPQAAGESSLGTRRAGAHSIYSGHGAPPKQCSFQS